MLELSIITINLNNKKGLQKTFKSVFSQTSNCFEYIVVDGGSTDGSLDVIKESQEKITHWTSEKDSGIYNAMNKGIKKASGNYIQILNSGDCLVNETVIERMLHSIAKMKYPNILYGNMIKILGNKKIRDCSFKGREISMLDMYLGTLNHSPVYIRRQLFDKYGYYDETLKAVSDWKWYFQAIIYGGEHPEYTDIDVVYFDMNGISTTNLDLVNSEKKCEMEKLLPASILTDYQKFSFYIEQMKRLKRFPVFYYCVWFLERILAKYEKYTAKDQSIK